MRPKKKKQGNKRLTQSVKFKQYVKDNIAKNGRQTTARALYNAQLIGTNPEKSLLNGGY